MKTITFSATVFAVLAAVAAPALAQGTAAGYPNKSLRLIVPFPPGGGNDILARTLGQRLAEVVSQQVVVDNRGGAGGALGATIAANGTPDGYTLFLGSVGNLAQNPALKPNLPYNPVRDFAPAALVATSSFILAVHPSVQAKSVQELIALAKASPGKLNYASAGTGSSLHMAGELFKYATATDMLHVPYKGTGPAMADLVSGRVQLIFSTMPPALPQIKSGKLRALGVTTAKRAAAAPEVPTIAESGVKGFNVSNWQGVLAPAKTPAAIVQKLNQDILAALRLPGMTEALAAQGLEPAGGKPEEFGALIKSEITKYTQVVKAAKISVD
ncbi:MAG: tripartite tricarboxylate transporter substrate binding protein [Betaproteobacteria bacterium]|nr:MAG: tripartite tricarboxylate transporter substrate binding protein [Betaproteobacteria bacterium]